MPKVKINNIEGVYTNGNVVNASLNYCQYTNGYIDKIGLHAKDYKVIDEKGIEHDNMDYNIVYMTEVMIDNDRDGNDYTNNNFISNYVYNPEYYTLIILKYVGFTDSSLYLLNSNNEISLGTIVDGNVNKVLNYKGVVYIYTDTKSYELSKINRTTNRLYNGEHYSENNFRLRELYPEYSFNTTITRFHDHYNRPYNNVDLKLDSDLFSPSIEVHNSDNGELLVSIKFYQSPEDSDMYYFKTGQVVSISLPDGAEVTYEYEGETIRVTQLEPNVEYPLSVLTNFCGHNDATLTLKTLLDSEIGFNGGLTNAYWVLTYVMSNGTELIYDVIEEDYEIVEDANSNPKEFGYAIYVTVPPNLDVRITSVRAYVKHSKDDFYQLIYEKPFYSTGVVNSGVTKIDLQGIYTSQTLGLVNITEQDKNKVIKVFDDVTIINGLFVAVNGDKILYPIIGNGRLTFLYYDFNTIPDIQGSLVFNINGILAVKDVNRIYAINIVSEEGVLLFSIKDEMGFIIDDKYSVIETPDAVVLLTNRGIFATDAEQLSLLSEPINNIILEDYKDCKMFYLYNINELWVVNNVKEEVYKYSFVNNNWTYTDYKNYQGIYVNRNNNIIAADNNTIYTLQLKDSDITYKSNPTSLNYTGMLKSITQIDFDFEGSITWDNKIATSGDRDTLTLYKSLNKRYLKDNEQFTFTLSAGSILYNMELYFNVEKKINEYAQ